MLGEMSLLDSPVTINRQLKQQEQEQQQQRLVKTDLSSAPLQSVTPSFEREDKEEEQSQTSTLHTLTFCAPHAHPLLPTAMAFVSYGFVLVRVRNLHSRHQDHRGPKASVFGEWRRRRVCRSYILGFPCAIACVRIMRAGRRARARI
jgi:hypothetical protein